MKNTLLILACFYFLLGCSTNNVVTTVTPLAPTNLAATIISNNQVDLQWNDNATNETGYKVQRKIIGASFADVGSTSADMTNFSDLGLTPNTTYIYRVYAYNSAGNSSQYSNEVTITTNPNFSLTTTIPTSVTGFTASSGGNISTDGGSPIIARGVCWSTNSSPTESLSTKTVDGTGIGSFTSNITGLTPNTTYHVRSYVSNSNGTFYGNEIIFNTIRIQYWRDLGNSSNLFFQTSQIIKNILFDNNNNLFVSGMIRNQNGNGFVAKWNGISWSQVGADFPAQPFDPSFYCMILNKNNNNIIGGGGFSNANGNTYVAKWDGMSWSETGGTNNSTNNYAINAVTVDLNNNIYIPISGPNIIKWNGVTWNNLPTINCTGTLSLSCGIVAMVSDGTNIYAAGGLDNINGKAFVAKWNGVSWNELGGLNTSTFSDNITNLAIDNNNNIYASGYFKNTNGYYYVAKWDGQSWSEIGGTNSSNFSSPISALHVDNMGNIYIDNLDSNGNFFMYKWNGQNWISLVDGNFVFNQGIDCITTDNEGNVYVGGYYTNSDGKVFVAKYGF